MSRCNVQRIFVVALAAAAIAIAVVPLLSVAHGTTFPPRMYPPPRYFPQWGLPVGCPSLVGVARVRNEPATRLLDIVGRFERVSKEYDQSHADRALWRVVRQYWRSNPSTRGAIRLRLRDVVFGHATAAPQASLVRRNCGKATLERSWWLAVCPIEQHRSRPCSLREAPARTTHLLFIRRYGRWLLWFQMP
jgi:hypothetical protein